MLLTVYTQFERVERSLEMPVTKRVLHRRVVHLHVISRMAYLQAAYTVESSRWWCVPTLQRSDFGPGHRFVSPRTGHLYLENRSRYAP